MKLWIVVTTMRYSFLLRTIKWRVYYQFFYFTEM